MAYNSKQEEKIDGRLLEGVTEIDYKDAELLRKFIETGLHNV